MSTHLPPFTPLLLLLALLAAACHSNPNLKTPSPAEDSFWESVHGEKHKDAPAPLQRVSRGTLARQDLIEFLDRGPAHLLAQVPVMPVLDDANELLGFRIEAFFPDAPDFHHVDLVRGDLVTAINGLRIERPEHLFDLYQDLRTAPRLQIDVIRKDTLRTLTWEIIDDTPRKMKKSATAPTSTVDKDPALGEN